MDSILLIARPDEVCSLHRLLYFSVFFPLSLSLPRCWSFFLSPFAAPRRLASARPRSRARDKARVPRIEPRDARDPRYVEISADLSSKLDRVLPSWGPSRVVPMSADAGPRTMVLNPFASQVADSTRMTKES